MIKLGKTTRIIFFATLLLALAGTLQAKEMYKWTDENGVVHFSESKPAGREVEAQNLPLDPAPQGDNPYQQAGADQQPSYAQQQRDKIAQNSEQARQQQAATKAQCSALQAEVDRLEPNRRVFTTNEKGETERMDDVERTNRVASLKQQIQQNCK